LRRGGEEWVKARTIGLAGVRLGDLLPLAGAIRFVLASGAT
jgi:hypothetical protein